MFGNLKPAQSAGQKRFAGKRDGGHFRNLKLWSAPAIALLTFSAAAQGSNPPVTLAFSPAALTFPENTCVPSTVLTKNNIGQQTAVTSNRTLDINQGPASLSFFVDSACTQKSSVFTIVSGKSSYTFYMHGTAAGTFSIRAQVAGLEPANQNVSVALPDTGTGTQNPPTTAPAQASAAGYNKLVFDDEFNSAGTISPNGSGSYNWYTTNFYTASATLPATGYQVSNGFLRIMTDASGYSDGIATVEPGQTSATWQHGYFESRIRFDPTGNKGSSWPAFWSYSIEGALNSVPSGSDFSELDFLECYPTGSKCTYITTVHQWQENTSGNTSVAQNSNNVPAVPSGHRLHAMAHLRLPLDSQPGPVVFR